AERICVGLPPACTGLDADGAAELRGRVDGVHTAIGLLTGAAPANPGTAAATDAGTGTDAGTDTSTNANAGTDTSTNANAGTGTNAVTDTGTDTGTDTDTDGLRGRWTAVLHKLAARDTVAGVIRGRATRLLLDEGRLAEDDAARLMGLALSPGTPPADAAEWIEGFVGGAGGGGMLLVHDERLLGLVDAWLTGVPADRFADVLPLLRRTFSAYEAGVRRTLGELVRRGPSAEGPVATGTG
ncbi:DUF5682 family protein, partial [Streptomyces sp. Wh19]|uniref:DUF5682 family protein n=1 Tax=Streptomyces sp. Wh19 TaxID=3076629 RepID=UPI0029585D0A